jgi:hypothetical protein
MNLEQLPKALLNIKDRLLVAVIDEAAPVANNELVDTLTKRATKKGPGGRQNQAVPSQLNQQQQKFLKQAPIAQEQPVTIQALKQNNGYIITASSTRINVTAADLSHYRKTISEQAIKTLDKLL